MFGENNMEESIIKELINSNAGVEEWKRQDLMIYRH